MGVYYVLANFDKKALVRPRRLGCGAKLTDILGSDFTRILPFLLMKEKDPNLDLQGSWYGDRIGFVSDGLDEQGLYEEISSAYQDISATLIGQFNAQPFATKVGVRCPSCEEYHDNDAMHAEGTQALCGECRENR